MSRDRDSLRAIWRKIKSRCLNPDYDSFPYYGARGIKICDRWRDSFSAFVEDMGPRPTPQHTVERKDNDGPYEKNNCRWATRAEQMCNTRRNIFTVVDGKKMHLSEACRVLGLTLSGVRYRIRIGWSIEQALAEPFGKHVVLPATAKREIRQIKGLSQDAIAIRFGVSQSAVSSIIRGRR